VISTIFVHPGALIQIQMILLAAAMEAKKVKAIMRAKGGVL